MISTNNQNMSDSTTTINITNQIDLTLAERGFIPESQIRSVILNDVLVDTGATRLCLPKNIILELGLPFQGEADVKIAAGVEKVRVFKMLNLSFKGREGVFNCIELPENCDPLLGLIPLEDLGLESDLNNQKLRVSPELGKDTYLTVL